MILKAVFDCRVCGVPHVDKENLAEYPHKKHLCHNCGGITITDWPCVGVIGSEDLMEKMIAQEQGQLRATVSSASFAYCNAINKRRFFIGRANRRHEIVHKAFIDGAMFASKVIMRDVFGIVMEGGANGNEEETSS